MATSTGYTSSGIAALCGSADWTEITKSDSDDNMTALYNWIRFDTGGSTTPLAVKFTKRNRGNTQVTLTRYVSSGEVWPAGRIDRIWATGTNSGVTVDGWA